MSEQISISIIIPARNRGNLLLQAIGSCALQSWRKREIIVVDDGSEENLPEVVEQAQRQFNLGSSVKYVRQDHLGANAARNIGLANSSGELIQFMDSDDLLHPRKLEIQAKHLLAKPDLDMVYCQDEHFCEIPGDLRVLWNVTVNWDGRGDLDRFLYEDAVWHTGSPLWRKAALNRIGGWHDSLLVWQDWEFFLKALCSGIRYESSNMVLQYIRQHRGIRSANAHSQLLLESSRIEAGKLANRHLVRAGLLTFGRRLLMLEFFLHRIDSVNAISDPAALHLRHGALRSMKGLALTRKQKIVLVVLCAMNETMLFKKLYKMYRNRWPSAIHPPKLRDIVQACDGSLPGPEFWRQVM